MKLDKRNKLLLIGFAVGVYISYTFAISKTVNYYNEFQRKNALLKSSLVTPKLNQHLKQKEQQLNGLLAQYKITSSSSFQNDLLQQIDLYCKRYHMRIVDFKEPHVIADKGLTTTSYIFTLEGSFNGCLALVRKIENNGSLGSIRHIDFIKKRDYKTNQDNLFVEIILNRNRDGS